MKTGKKLICLFLSLFLAVAAAESTAFAYAFEGEETEYGEMAEAPDILSGTEESFSSQEGFLPSSGVSLRKSEEGSFSVEESSLKGAADFKESFSDQLNARQKAFYDELEGLTLERILRAVETDGYHTVFSGVKGAQGLKLSGRFDSKRNFIPTGASQSTVQALYTDLLAAIVAYRYDHPEAIWSVSMQYGYRWDRSGPSTVTVTGVTFGFRLLYKGEEKELYEQMMESAYKLASQASGGDCYTRVRSLHDLLASSCAYLGETEDEKTQQLSHTPFSALVAGDEFEPVCDGYAKAFKLLCDQLEIPCVLCVSEEHMWNNVKMDDGEWYHVDVTWDDRGEAPVYDCFLLGDRSLLGQTEFSKEKDHIERNPYRKPSGHQDMAFSYPKKSREAYVYLGRDYAPLSFPDVTRSAWYFEAVEEAHELGIFEGDEHGNFCPGNRLTRAQFAKALANALHAQLNEEEESSFSDVKPGKWYASVAAWVQKEGIMQGHDGKFRPDAPISREEMCVVFARVMELQGASSDFRFPDHGKIASWAREAVYACYEKGLIKGDEKGNFNPKNYTARREAAVVFTRWAQGA